MRKCCYYCTWQMCQLLSGYAKLQLHPNQNIYDSSSCPREICCDLMVQPCGCVRQSEREPTQHKSHTMSRVLFFFFTFFHTAFKIWMQEWRMQIAFGFLFLKKKEIQKGGEGRREAPLKQPKYIHASSWLEFLVWCCRATAQRCSRY